MDYIRHIWTKIDTTLLLTWGGQVLAALLIFFVGRFIARLISKTLTKIMHGRGLDDMLVGFLSSILYAILLIAVVIAALGQLGVTTTPLVAILGAAGLAVGFALQGSLSNFAAGIMLIVFRPFRAGDFVDAGGIMGTIKEVGIFHTILNTPDNRRIIVPNSQVTGGTITNFSAYDTRRIDLLICVDYKDDLRLARNTIDEVLRANQKILKDPEPVILLMELGESSIDFAVRPWVKSADYWVVRGELLEQIKVALESAGCSIPFPQRDVHLHQIEGSIGQSSKAV